MFKAFSLGFLIMALGQVSIASDKAQGEVVRLTLAVGEDHCYKVPAQAGDSTQCYDYWADYGKIPVTELVIDPANSAASLSWDTKVGTEIYHAKVTVIHNPADPNNPGYWFSTIFKNSSRPDQMSNLQFGVRSLSEFVEHRLVNDILSDHANLMIQPQNVTARK